MKLLLIGPINSIHFKRWIISLSEIGWQVHVVSQHKDRDFCFPKDVVFHQLKYSGQAGYFLNFIHLKRLVASIQPDIINCHYASGYGTMAMLAKCSRLVMSVWGSDVYDFPFKSKFHKWLIRKNLTSAATVASTSNCMAMHVKKLCPEIKKIKVTPFGVDLNVYVGITPKPAKQKSKLVIGTVKTMSPKYGIDTLIDAFALLLQLLRGKMEFATTDIELRLVGGGEQTVELRALAKRLGIADKVNFVGQVPHSLVPQELAKLDIYVALSRQESFGVAVIEAAAAGIPVVVSDTGGLPEVMVHLETGFVVPKENPGAAAMAMERLALDPGLRYKMGHAGQAYVAHHYSWDACVQTMLDVYAETIQYH